MSTSYFFPFGNAPVSTDTEVVSLQKINALLVSIANGSGGGGGGGAGNPGGTNGQIQYNNSGVFAGTATGSGVLGALAGTINSGSGLPTLSSGLLRVAQQPGLVGDVVANLATISTTVVGINGVNLAGIGSGLLKSGFGIPSIAVAGTDYCPAITSPGVSDTGQVLFNDGGNPATSTLTYSSLTKTYDLPSASFFIIDSGANLSINGTMTGTWFGTGVLTALNTNTNAGSGLLTLSSGVIGAAQFPALTGDVTNTAGSLATTVGKINGTSLAGLATGILFNTTSTGVPSIATANQVAAGLTGTTGTLNLSSATLTLPAGYFTNPMTTLGDIIYGGASGVATRLAGQTTITTRGFLTQTESGSAAAAPAWFDLFGTSNTWSNNQIFNGTGCIRFLNGGNNASYSMLNIPGQASLPNSNVYPIGGQIGTVPLTIFSVTTPASAVANTTTATTVVGTSATTRSFSDVPSATIPANSWVIGATFEVEAWGYYSTTLTPTAILTLKIGSTVVDTTTTTTLGASVTNSGWHYRGIITCQTIGSSGTVFVQGNAEFFTAAGVQVPASGTNTTTSTINTTGALLIDLQWQWSAASTSNTASCSNFILKRTF